MGGVSLREVARPGELRYGIRVSESFATVQENRAPAALCFGTNAVRMYSLALGAHPPDHPNRQLRANLVSIHNIPKKENENITSGKQKHTVTH